jgi:gliding motility-associated-like protein
MAYKPRLLIFILVSMFSTVCLAEGTKQLRPDSILMSALWIQNGGGGYSCFATESCGPDQKLYIHIAHTGEKIFMGFQVWESSLTFKLKLNGVTVYTRTVLTLEGAPGYIKYHSQAVAGPGILNPHGYQPVTFVPAEPGEYSIEFQVPSAPAGPEFGIHLVDITVIDTTKTPLSPINGRLWSRDWGFNTYNIAEPRDAFLATQYILTSDSIVTSVNYNHMQGWNFDVTSTRNGCYPWPNPWDSSCRSRAFNHHYAQYQIFINDPDSFEYPTGTSGVILGDTVAITRQCDGSFSFTFSVNKPGNVKLNIETNLEPGIQPEDLTLNREVNQGVNSLFWNGRNGIGAQVPCGDSVAITINYINGLTNIALYDVENHPDGFIIRPVRPAGAPIASYWNDTLLANKGGQMQLSGCYFIPPDEGCHSWTGAVGSGIGSHNTINTWWYAASSVLDLGRFRVNCVPHIPQGISGPDSLCLNKTATYTVDPDPLPGSESNGYEWVLTDATTGAILFDSTGAGSSLGIHFPGSSESLMRLKVRGKSDFCGAGPFGPVNGGIGILIHVFPSPQITNMQNRFSICSGDTTNVFLQSSMAGTAYTYTIQSSSPTITGQSGGTQNPIRQMLINTATSIDSVIYQVIPYMAPCSGDTVTFTVIVNPKDSIIIPVSVSPDQVCEGSEVTLTIPSLLVGPTATVEWKVNGMITGPNAPVFTYTPSNNDKVLCTVSSQDFCTPGKMGYSRELILNVLPKVPVSLIITPSANPVCKGEPVTLTAVPLNGGVLPVYQWWINGINIGVNDSTYTYLPANGDEVICRMHSNLSCVLNNDPSGTIMISEKQNSKTIDTTLCYGVPYLAEGIWQTTPGIYHDTLTVPVSCVRYIETNLKYKQQIPVELGKDTTVCSNFFTLNAFYPGGTYLWQDGSVDPVYQVTCPGAYKVTVSYDGCSQLDSIIIGECPAKLWFPNSFTPNGDGLNDTFHPKGEGVEKFSIRIYNRWGEMIFVSNTLEPGWDGTCKGSPCAEDTYIYIASFEGSAGETMQEKGTVTLQR